MVVLNHTIKFTFVTELYMDNYDIEKQKEGLVDLVSLYGSHTYSSIAEPL